jgi:CRISPR type I-E-associated protein CasB/Cse2
MDVLLVEAYHALRAELPHAATDRLTLVAAVLAHVKRDDPSRPLGRQLAGAGHAAPVNPRRFRNLLSASREWPGVQREFTRTVKLLDHTVNVRDLARSLYVWDEATRRRLALDYFENAPTPKEE